MSTSRRSCSQSAIGSLVCFLVDRGPGAKWLRDNSFGRGDGARQAVRGSGGSVDPSSPVLRSSLYDSSRGSSSGLRDGAEIGPSGIHVAPLTVNRKPRGPPGRPLPVVIEAQRAGAAPEVGAPCPFMPPAIVRFWPPRTPPNEPAERIDRSGGSVQRCASSWLRDRSALR